VHLDGYDQTDMLTKGGKSARNEFWYFTQSQLAAGRIGDFKYVMLDQPDGWDGNTIQYNFPRLYNLRLDPFERMEFSPGESFIRTTGTRNENQQTNEFNCGRGRRCGNGHWVQQNRQP